MKEAYQEIYKIGGARMVEEMQQMARDLVNGDKVFCPEFYAIKESRFKFFK
jgi:protein-tyrosine phosphatase